MGRRHSGAICFKAKMDFAANTVQREFLQWGLAPSLQMPLQDPIPRSVLPGIRKAKVCQHNKA